MARAADRLWTLDRFLTFDVGTDTRYELIGARVVGMAPPAEAHGELTSKPAVAIGRRLQPPCRVITQDVLAAERAPQEDAGP